MLSCILSKIKRHKLIDEKDMREIAFSFCRDNNCSFYLKNVVFDPKLDCLGFYDHNSKTIYLSPQLMEDIVNKRIKIEKKYIDIPNESIPLITNFYKLYMIFHELRHVICRCYKETGNISEQALPIFLYDLSRDIHVSFPELYKSHHNLFPSEVDANGYGFLYAYEFITRVKLSSKEKNLLLFLLYKVVLAEYKKVDGHHISPIERLKLKTTFIDLDKVESLIKEKGLSLKTCLLSGLPLTEEQFEKILRRKSITYQKIKI